MLNQSNSFRIVLLLLTVGAHQRLKYLKLMIKYEFIDIVKLYLGKVNLVRNWSTINVKWSKDLKSKLWIYWHTELEKQILSKPDKL